MSMRVDKFNRAHTLLPSDAFSLCENIPEIQGVIRASFAANLTEEERLVLVSRHLAKLVHKLKEENNSLKATEVAFNLLVNGENIENRNPSPSIKTFQLATDMKEKENEQ